MISTLVLSFGFGFRLVLTIKGSVSHYAVSGLNCSTNQLITFTPTAYARELEDPISSQTACQRNSRPADLYIVCTVARRV